MIKIPGVSPASTPLTGWDRLSRPVDPDEGLLEGNGSQWWLVYCDTLAQCQLLKGTSDPGLGEPGEAAGREKDPGGQQ